MPSIEIFLYLSVLTLATFLVVLGYLSPTACIWTTVALLVMLIFLAWKQFHGGRHPCFLFLAMLFVFQGGRLAGLVLGTIQNPMRIDVATLVPIDVSRQSMELTLLAITLSAICVYAPCRLQYRSVIFEPGREVTLLPSLYLLIALTFGFAVYKNMTYLLYIRSHGGYLAVFTDNAAVLRSAGPVARIASMICTTAMTIAFVFERRSKQIALVVFLLVCVSTLDLLIGFRGKVFAQLITLWFIHNLKTGKRFMLLPVVGVALSLNIVAVLVAGYREEHRVELLTPIGFLTSEGVSINVTEAAIEFRSRFARYGLDYLAGGFTAGLNPPSTSHEGQLWTEDLTTFLNPVASTKGYGTASTYLAELYLLGGISAVAFGSLLIGFCLSWLHHSSATSWGAVLSALLLPSLIYLPRLELLNPLAELIKSLAAIMVITVFVQTYRWSARVVLDRHKISALIPAQP